MRIGVMIGGGNPDELISQAKEIEERGFDAVWMTNSPGYGLDTLNGMMLIAHETNRIKLGTAVVPIYLHHPAALAQSALSIQKAAQGRFTLGIGLSHPVILEEWLGLSYKNVVNRLDEYLSILLPLLSGETAAFKGDFYRADVRVHLSDVEAVPVLIAAMGPKMLKLAGMRTDGTVTYLTGLHTLESHIIPRIHAAAKDAGRSAPRIVAGGLPIALVDDVDGTRAEIAKQYAGYSALPTYRAMLDREGVADPADVALLGNADVLKESLTRLARIGVTDFIASPFSADENAYERTIDFLTAQL
jgi:F420-dependent oxidoreductase-like protein